MQTLSGEARRTQTRSVGDAADGASRFERLTYSKPPPLAAVTDFVEGLLGHASVATTGRYLQLTDQMAKQIALRTETALDPGTETEKDRKARERGEAYRLNLGEWDSYASQVLEWLARTSAHARNTHSLVRRVPAK